jgi:cytochrome c-type biogenesis protein CcmE
VTPDAPRAADGGAVSSDVADPGAGEGFDESSTELDLSPRQVAPARPRRQRPVGVYLALAAVVLAIGFVVLQGLSDATLYFRNVDEAVAQADELGTRRFRLQGLVDGEPDVDGDHVTFTLAFGGETIAVDHTGDPPDLFRVGQPVVLEGRLVAGSAPLTFASDRILVKHSEEYEAEHEDRIVDAEDGEEG